MEVCQGSQAAACYAARRLRCTRAPLTAEEVTRVMMAPRAAAFETPLYGEIIVYRLVRITAILLGQLARAGFELLVSLFCERVSNGRGPPRARTLR